MSLINIGSETEQIEYKKSIGELKEAMFSIAAILNKHQKGELYFGVKNDGTVIGQEIMIRKRDNIDYSWEKKVSKYTIDDMDEDAFSEYLRKAKEAGRIDFEDTDVKTVLNKLELIEGGLSFKCGGRSFL